MAKHLDLPHEWHVTVETGRILEWHEFCVRLKAKPLLIELNNFERQQMCSIKPKDLDWFLMWQERLFPNVLRMKHEVMCPVGESVPGAVYYEAHAKLTGPFRPELALTSRNLYSDKGQWYCTYRSPVSFNPLRFRLWLEQVQRLTVSSVEYEACLHDSNPALDSVWQLDGGLAPQVECIL